jgi:MFS family permease
MFSFLPNSPGQAKFLSEGEQTEAVERMQTKDRTPKNKVHWNQLLAGILDYRNVVHTLIHFMCNYSLAGLSNFLPTILKGMGYSSINAQGLTAPVCIASFLLCVVAALASDRLDKKGFIVAGFATMGCIGCLSLATIEDKTKTGVRYFGV